MLVFYYVSAILLSGLTKPGVYNGWNVVKKPGIIVITITARTYRIFVSILVRFGLCTVRPSPGRRVQRSKRCKNTYKDKVSPISNSNNSIGMLNWISKLCKCQDSINYVFYGGHFEYPEWPLCGSLCKCKHWFLYSPCSKDSKNV